MLSEPVSESEEAGVSKSGTVKVGKLSSMAAVCSARSNHQALDRINYARCTHQTWPSWNGGARPGFLQSTVRPIIVSDRIVLPETNYQLI